MNKKIPILIMLCAVLAAMLFPTVIFADESDVSVSDGETVVSSESENQYPPTLTAIEFYGAALKQSLTEDVYEYDLIVESADEFALKSYKCSDYKAQVNLEYIANTSGATKGIIVTVKNDAGANDYKFYFDTVQLIAKTSDATLTELSFNYGEIHPAFDPNVFKYTLYLPTDLEILIISPVTGDVNAYVSTPSEVKLAKGKDSIVSVKITSSDGSVTNTYRLNIKRVDKTVEQVQEEMADPDFQTFVEIPFYKTAQFYIMMGTGVFAIAVLAVVAVSVAKHKKAAANARREEVQQLSFDETIKENLTKKELKQRRGAEKKAAKQRKKDIKKTIFFEPAIAAPQKNTPCESDTKDAPEAPKAANAQAKSPVIQEQPLPKKKKVKEQLKAESTSAGKDSETPKKDVEAPEKDAAAPKTETAEKPHAGRKETAEKPHGIKKEAKADKDQDGDDWLNFDKYNKYR